MDRERQVGNLTYKTRESQVGNLTYVMGLTETIADNFEE